MNLSEQIQALCDAVLRGPGQTSPDQRAIVERFAAAVSNRNELPREIDEPLRGWVTKVALHAYQTSAGDVDALRAAGHSENEIFELTVAAALGAARARYDRALAVLPTESSE